MTRQATWAHQRVQIVYGTACLGVQRIAQEYHVQVGAENRVTLRHVTDAHDDAIDAIRKFQAHYAKRNAVLPAR